MFGNYKSKKESKWASVMQGTIIKKNKVIAGRKEKERLWGKKSLFTTEIPKNPLL